MKFLLLFVLMCLVGGVGGGGGALLGGGLGRGGVFAGGFAGGTILVVAAGFLAAKVGWVRPEQRFWTIVGALLGFGAAAIVTLATLSSPIGPAASTLLVGMGATLGALIGLSAHRRLDA
ncbi:MAG: hypothetical protein WD801_09925 [Gemmatimonadaceae bacterium]